MAHLTVGVEHVEEEIPELESLAIPARIRNIAAGMTSLDAVNIKTVFERRASVMRSVPHVLSGCLPSSVQGSIE